MQAEKSQPALARRRLKLNSFHCIIRTVKTILISVERWLSWSKALAWKASNGDKPFEGSNPSLSAIFMVWPC